MAFDSKNLQYNKRVPAFLQKLRSEYGGVDGRQGVQAPRPKRDRLKTADDGEDDPVIVDEQGEIVAKGDWERRVREGDGADETGMSSATTDPAPVAKDEHHAGKQKVAEIGSTVNFKKRKAVKAMGAEDSSRDDDSWKSAIRAQDNTVQTTSKATTKTTPAKAVAKKGKKVKLSFDDTDG